MERQASLVAHWIYPTLGAAVAIIAIGGVLVTTGSTTQRLLTTEQEINDLKRTTIKHSELDYRLDSFDKKIDDFDRKLDRMLESQRRKP